MIKHVSVFTLKDKSEIKHFVEMLEEVGVLVERKAAVDLSLVHTGCKRGLLSVAQRKISDFKIFSHCSCV